MATQCAAGCHILGNMIMIFDLVKIENLCGLWGECVKIWGSLKITWQKLVN